MDSESVNVQGLLLSTEKVNHGFFAFEIDPSKIEQFEHNDLINDWHIEHIRRFNATAEHLVRSLLQVQALGQLLAQGVLVGSAEGLPVNVQKEHRIACRDAFLNIDIYLEAVKAFCRYYFFMDPKLTDEGDKWYRAMRQYSSIDGWSYIEAFLSQCKQIKEDEIITFLTQVRNDEVHNESPIELIKYAFGDNLTPIPKEYVISNQDLHNYITHAVSLLVVLSQRLQDIIDHISPGHLYNYLKDQNGKLKFIIKMEDRYKRERDVFSGYHVDGNPSS